ncbi:MAG: CHAT domain-containing protein [Bacteroidales bacterium]|nr:CHAT domain-containing protein [Bacteroidales bacterium]MBN2749795.1 CHAT domain-containing protein [Bacteroidales bacterium]
MISPNAQIRQRTSHCIICICLTLVAYLSISNTKAQTTKIGYEEKDSLARLYNNIGVDYAVAGNFNKASLYLKKSLDIKTTIPNYDKNKLAVGYLNLSNIKKELDQIDSTIYYIQLAEQFILAAKEPNEKTKAIILVEKGSLAMQENDYQTAIANIKQGIELLEQLEKKDDSRIVMAKLKLATALRVANKLADAIKESQDALALAEKKAPDFVYFAARNLGNSLLKKENTNQAIEAYSLALKTYNTHNRKNEKDISALLSNMGIAFFNLNKHNKAREYHKYAIQNHLLSKNYSKSTYTQIINNLAFLEFNTGNIDSAFKYANLSIASNIIRTEHSPTNSSKRKFLSPLTASRSYALLASCYKEKKEVESFADSSMNYYLKAISILNETRHNLFVETDKLTITENNYKTYESAISAAFEFAETDSKFIEHAFRFMSLSKAAVLHEMLARNKNLQIAENNKELYQLEKRSRLFIGHLSGKLIDEQGKDTPNTNQIKKIEAQIASVQTEYGSIIERIKNEDPQYFNLRFDTTTLSIVQVQKRLSAKQTIIEYFATESNISSVAITKNEVLFSTKEITKEERALFKEYQKMLIPKDFGKVTTKSLEEFTKTAYALYQILLSPYDDMVRSHELIIIPHSYISQVPFSTLIASIPERLDGFYSLPYLVYSNNIIYAPSSKVLFELQPPKKELFNKSLSVAPSYLGVDTTGIASRKNYRGTLSDLPGARSEAESVSRFFRGDLVLDTLATESRIKQMAAKYDILHLAMHTFIDEQNPFFSKLIFANEKSATEDGFLNTYEIYNLTLNCKLAILSACESATGTEIKGEGLLGLARGFFYAGCPTLIATQWKVDDAAGNRIIEEFASNIKKGLSVNESLRQSQISFLQQADPLKSHPYFWASYIAIGDSSPLYFKNTTKIAIAGILALVAGLLAVAILRRRINLRKQKQRQI